MDQSAASLTNNDLRHNGVQDEGYGLSLFVANNCEDLVSAEDNMLDASAQKPDGRLSPFLAQFSSAACQPNDFRCARRSLFAVVR